MAVHPRSSRALALASLILISAVSLACCPLINLPTGLGGGSKCTVPDLVGQREAPARLSLSELGLHPVETNEHSDAFDTGMIIRTDPPAGTELDPCEGDVLMLISLGPAVDEEPTPQPATEALPPTQPPPPGETEPTTPAQPIDPGPMAIHVYDEGFDHGTIEAFRPEWNVDAVPEAAYTTELGNLVTEQYVAAWIGDETWFDYALHFGNAFFDDVTEFHAMIRVQDEENFVGITCFKTEGRLQCEGEKVVNGQSATVPNFMQQTATMYVDGQIEGSDIELRAVGNEFTVLRDGQVVGRMTDNEYASGGAGFIVDGRWIVDSIHVYEPTKPASPAWTYVRDDFSRTQWPTGETEDEIAWVSRELLPDAYRMQVRALVDDTVVAYETLPVYVPFNPSGFPYEFKASVRTSKHSGPESTGMGLLFGCRDEEACYEFSIIPDEGTALLSRIDEEGWVELEGPVQIGSLPQYDNVLTVIGSGGTCSCLVNDQPVITTRLDDAAHPRIGLSVQVAGEGYVGVVTFDDIVVSQAVEAREAE